MYVSHGSCDEDRVEPKLVTFSIDDVVVKVPPSDSGDFYESANLTITMLMMTATRTNETGLIFSDIGKEEHEEEIRRFWKRYRGRPASTQRICTTIRKLLERVRVKRGGGEFVDSESLVSFYFSVVVRVKVCRFV